MSKTRKEKPAFLTEEWAKTRLKLELADAKRRVSEAHARFRARMSEIQRVDKRTKTLPLSAKAKAILLKRIDGPITRKAAAAVIPKNGSRSIAEINAWIKQG